MRNSTESKSEIENEMRIETNGNEMNLEKQGNELWSQSTIDELKENMIETIAERQMDTMIKIREMMCVVLSEKIIYEAWTHRLWYDIEKM